jgi:hypothetical protein
MNSSIKQSLLGCPGSVCSCCCRILDLALASAGKPSNHHRSDIGLKADRSMIRNWHFPIELAASDSSSRSRVRDDLDESRIIITDPTLFLCLHTFPVRPAFRNFRCAATRDLGHRSTGFSRGSRRNPHIYYPRQSSAFGVCPILACRHRNVLSPPPMVDEL